MEKKYSVDSDARQTPPSFDEMVELIKKLFTDYLEDVIKSKPSEIAKSWERYKVLNHLYKNAQTDTPISFYQPLFDHMYQEHGLTLLESEMADIIHLVQKME